MEHPKLIAAFKKGTEKLVYMRHSKFPAADITLALEAPCTEVLFWTLPESTNREEFDAGVQKLAALIGSELKDAVLSINVGKVIEDEKIVSLLLGWRSFEVRPIASFVSFSEL